MTYASKSDLFSTSKRTRGIVICPRANAALAEGIPDIQLMQKTGNTIGLGTDNVMINSPDMFREMDYLWKVSMGISKKRINPKDILKMATVNGGRILKKDIGVIETGKLATQAHGSVVLKVGKMMLFASVYVKKPHCEKNF